MTHLSESELLRAADGEPSATASAHLTTCETCQALVDDQRAAHAMLTARPILPARDLSAAIRATLEAERPSTLFGMVDRLNINWRLWSFRVAPLAAALALVAMVLVRTADTTTATGTVATDTTSTSPVVSALWSGDVSEDALFNLFLTARPDDALGSYVPENK